MLIRTLALALAAVSLAAASQAQTTSPAKTASSNGKDASTVTTTPPQDPTLGSGQTATSAKPKAMKTHHRAMGSKSSSGMSHGGTPAASNATGSGPGA